MVRLIGLFIGFVAAAIVGFKVVYAQTSTPWPSPSPTPIMIIDNDTNGDGVVDSNDNIQPEGAPRTGFGGLSK